MTSPDHDLSPALQEWVDARQRETDFAKAATQSSKDQTGKQKTDTATALREIAQTGNCGQGVNLQNALDYLSKPLEKRTADDADLFSTAVENLLGAFGPNNVDMVYRAWERRPQPEASRE